jgi:hypothetical protein
MRVYLAATQDIYSGSADVEVHRLLTSYLGKADDKIPNALAHAGFYSGKPDAPTDWCVDSGAHHWISKFFKTGTRDPVEKIEAHMENLCNYIRNLDAELQPTWTVEMDLQDIYGIDLINEWREKYWYPLEVETGVRVCYVMHGSDSDDTWQEMLAHPSMNLLGMSIVSGQPLGRWIKRGFEAYEACKPVHGFACVKAKRMAVIPFWSVDSTSWGAGSMFGTVSSFNARIGKVQEGHAGRRTYRKDPKEAIGKLLKTRGRVQVRDVLGTSAGGSLSRLYQNAANEYAKMERYYNSYWKAKGIDWQKQLKE